MDNNSIVFNSEFRFPIFWRVGGIVGFDAGKVWGISDFGVVNQFLAYNPVLGLRFYADTFVVRVDVGIGSETTGVYFNFRHIF